MVLGIGMTTLSVFTPNVPKQKKDFSHTKYADDFVTKYSLEKKFIKTGADKTFEAKWNVFTRTTANYLQQYVMDCDYSETQTKLKQISDDLSSYSAFLSYDCKTDYIEKIKQVNYKVSETLQTKRL